MNAVIKPTAPEPEPVTPLTQDEINLIVQAARHNDDYFIYVFSIFTGLRIGETLALTMMDVDDGIIRVNKSVAYTNETGTFEYHVTAPKTRESKRDIPIMNELKPLLQFHMQKVNESALKLGHTVTPNSLLFPSWNGGHRDDRVVRRGLQRLLKRLGIPEHIRAVHMLRHTFCSLLCTHGVQETIAAKLMGHSDTTLIAKVYAHINQTAKQAAINSLEGVIRLQPEMEPEIPMPQK
jgi:integrase